MASTDPARPDYTSPAYLEMQPRWDTVDDVRGGTDDIRLKKETYLPKFEAETIKDWDARVLMTFAGEEYATTIEEHVGLVMAEGVTLGEDVPKQIVDLTEDIDGEGNHLDVFAGTALDAAMHHGHVVLLTDYPVTDNIKTIRDAKKAQVRPYVQLYDARDVLSAQTVVIGGVQVLVQIMFRECASVSAGEYGVKKETRYREFRQEVYYDATTERPVALGVITWRSWREEAGVFVPTGNGVISGPERIPARVVYGGQKLGFLFTKPHLYGLAQASTEETQVGSDYACVMHKCNVPTPVFIGRNVDPTKPGTVQMGQGIDVPIGGDVKMLEPAGTAIAATRARLQDIQLRMQRQGASAAQTEGGPALTATEAAQYAKARNAKLRKAARSLQDALEGVLADMAAFMGIATTDAVKSGGSVTISQNFTGMTLDPAYLTVLVTAYREGALTIEELRYVLQTGELPETFDPEDVLALVAAEAARQDAATAAATEKMDQPRMDQKAAA